MWWIFVDFVNVVNLTSKKIASIFFLLGKFSHSIWWKQKHISHWIVISIKLSIADPYLWSRLFGCILLSSCAMCNWNWHHSAFEDNQQWLLKEGIDICYRYLLIKWISFAQISAPMVITRQVHSDVSRLFSQVWKSCMQVASSWKKREALEL